ncbi:MAG TPA: hypothetical protein VFM06_01175 [Candidatus Limnocylindria bacterium]|nr:hypothetical protein [Candidatus Limnocylindria bacterium]
MGESSSARTDRELSALRSSIDSDLRMLEERVREDLDPRRLAKRNPIAVFGALGSVLAIGTVTTVRSLKQRALVRSDTDLDTLIARLGGRVNKLRGRARKRLRAQLRQEIGEVERAPKPQQLVTEAVSGALTAALTLVARRFASRLVADEELPAETIDATARRRPRT